MELSDKLAQDVKGDALAGLVACLMLALVAFGVVMAFMSLF